MENLDIKITSILFDTKIDAYNIAFEISKKNYLAIAKDIKENNELQRKKIKRASSVYSLMKNDLKEGCLLPPIVLSLDNNLDRQDIKKELENQKDSELIKKYINKHYKKIKILDGLQRTNMLLELYQENNLENTSFYTNNLRFEIYIGIGRFGILYRMLTLNTGQTPMSLRHQIEILYSDLYSEDIKENIYLIREKDKITKKIDLHCYHFDDIIDGLESYIKEDELTLDRFDLLEYIKDLEKLSESDKKQDIFTNFVSVFDTLIVRLNTIFEGVIFNQENLTEEEEEVLNDKKPFGVDCISIFTASQSITGFGAAVSKDTFETINENIKKIISNDAQKALHLLIIRLSDTKNASRIGDKQRNFFKLFFQFLFDKNETNFIIETAIEKAYKSIQR